jgi:hypothetical protein
MTSGEWRHALALTVRMASFSDSAVIETPVSFSTAALKRRYSALRSALPFSVLHLGQIHDIEIVYQVGQ